VQIAFDKIAGGKIPKNSQGEIKLLLALGLVRSSAACASGEKECVEYHVPIPVHISWHEWRTVELEKRRIAELLSKKKSDPRQMSFWPSE
jgi:hypothetical protein